MSFDFTGKRCLVTRAEQGIGRALTVKLHSMGAQVVAISNFLEELEGLEVQCPGIQTVLCDVGNWDKVRLELSDMLPIHLLINNASVANAQTFLDVTHEALEQTFNINVFATVNIAQIVSKDLIKRGLGGSIVNLSNIASKTSVENALSYSGTKGAVNTITKCMAKELGPFNIRVNAILPTVVSSEFTDDFLKDPKLRGTFLARHPLGSFANVKDVVNAILFLLSDESSFITGVELPIDGGLLTN